MDVFLQPKTRIMKKIYLALSLFSAAFIANDALTQTTITQWDFNNITPGEIATATPSTGVGTLELVGGTTTVTSGSSGVGSSDAAAANSAFQTTTYPDQSVGNQSAGVQFNVSTVGFENIHLIFDLRLSNTASRWIQVQYTTDGNTWSNLGNPVRQGGLADDSAGDMWINNNSFDFSAISAVNDNPNFAVRIVTSFSPQSFTVHNNSTSFGANEAYEPARNPSTGANSNYAGGTMRYDMVTIEGDQIQLLPIINATTNALSNFIQVIDNPSDVQSFSISAVNLSSSLNLVVSAPYEISLSNASDFQSTLNIVPFNGIVNSINVFVRLNSAVSGNFDGNITLSADGATDVNITLSGTSVEELIPALSATPQSLNPFTQNIGFPSNAQVVTVAGENLTANLILTSNENFYISTDQNGPFTQLLSLTPVSGTIAETEVYVILNAQTAGAFNGVLSLNSAGAVAVEIPLTGETLVQEGSLLYYWHFNQLVTPQDVTSIDADYSMLLGFTGKFDYTNPFEGQRDMDAFDTGSLLNVQMGEDAGKACRVRNPSTDRTLDFFVPTNNANGIHFAYAVHRSGQGMLENIISYSINGIDFITTDLENNVIEITEDYQFVSIDFSNIDAVNDNPNFRIRIAFNGNTVASNGNNRFDNITLFADTYANLENNQLPVVSVFPNPAEDIIRIATDYDVVSVHLIDLNGRVVLTSSSDTVSISELNAGMYFVIIETSHGTVQKPLIKK